MPTSLILSQFVIWKKFKMNNAFNQINGVSGSGRCIIRNDILIFFILAGIFTFLLSPLYVFAQVEADVATAKEIQALHEADIMALPGVIGIGIGSREEGGVEFVVLVDKDAPMPDLPSNLEGMPVVAEKISKIVIHNGGISCDPCHAEELPMPVPMGTSTSTDQGCIFGTAGFKACDNASGKIGYVTNNHIGAAFGLDACENGLSGLIEVHPGTGDAPFCGFFGGTMPIGTLSKVVPINFPSPNLVDAAFVESNNQETSSIIRDIGTPTTTPGTPTLNKCVKKSGRTTGLTFGRITIVDMTVGVSGYCGGVATFQDLFRFTPDDSCGLCEDPPCSSIALSGDSGSAVLDLNNNIVGLYFGGDVDTGTSGVAATIQNVLNELNISLDLLNCSGPPPTPTPTPSPPPPTPTPTPSPPSPTPTPTPSPPSPTPTPTPSPPSPTPTPTPSPPSPTPTPTPSPPSPTPTPTPDQEMGDANQDGVVTSADITCVIRGIFGLPCPNPDCNGDGSVTSGDVTCVIFGIFNQ